MRPFPCHASSLKAMIQAVHDGALSRRRFVQACGSLGLSLPVAGTLLLHAGLAGSQPTAPAYKPTRRGGGGVLRILQAEGPTLLNPHFATGLKDSFGSRIFYEPLAQWDLEANLVPILAAEIPSRANGGLAADGRSVTWKLKPDVQWHDGTPFTADDVLFNWQFAIDPAAATVTLGAYGNLRLEKLDSHTLRVVFAKPSPFWPGQYSQVMLIPRHLFEPYMGSRSREAPTNLKPVGTGPYVCTDFKPADMIRGRLNQRYHMPARPHFDGIEVKGGGDSTSAARAVLQTGEFDFAGSLLVEDDVLNRIEAGGMGRVVVLPSSATTAIYLNFSDPYTELDGERSNPKSRHPVFSDPAVRRAIGLLIDRQALQDVVYGRQGRATANFINVPPRYRSPNMRWEYSVDKAVATLDAAGWKPGADGVREKSGRRLSFLLQGAISPVTNKVQQIVKQAAQKAGIAIELKAVTPSVFFSSDVGNPDTYGKFLADIQTYNWTNGSPDPEGLMQCFVSWEASSKSNKWLGQNLVRWQSAEFDGLYRAAEAEIDPLKRAALFIRMNDLVVSDGYVIPVIARNTVRAIGRNLVAPLSGWQVDVATLHDWYRDG